MAVAIMVRPTNTLPLLVAWQLFLASSFILNSASAFSAAPPWDQLHATPSLSNKPSRPIYQDSLPEDVVVTQQKQQQPVLYRDKDCICAASQSVWLALECKNVEYLTVLVSKEEDEAIPRIDWPKNDNNVIETDPIKLLEQIQKRYPDQSPHFYPKLSMAVDSSRCSIMRLPGIMPRYSHPDFDSKAPFLFREDGTLVIKSSHEVSLEEVEEMQEEYFMGNYLCGRDVCAADMVWAPYLERYAVQLPLLFPNKKSCNPRSNRYDEVNAWYVAMEGLPEYACCVQGDARHWRTCLERAIPMHNERATSDEEKVNGLPPVPNQFGWWMKRNPRGEVLWKEYANESRPWLADTPSREVALYLMRNHEEITTAAASSMELSLDDADEALREVIQLLVNWKMGEGVATLSENGQKMAQFTSERIEVPRDMAMVPALALWELVQLIL